MSQDQILTLLMWIGKYVKSENVRRVFPVPFAQTALVYEGIKVYTVSIASLFLRSVLGFAPTLHGEFASRSLVTAVALFPGHGASQCQPRPARHQPR